MTKRAVQAVNHQFVIRVWQEACCQQPTGWRIRIHHVNSGNVSFSTDLTHALDQIKGALGLVDDKRTPKAILIRSSSTILHQTQR